MDARPNPNKRPRTGGKKRQPPNNGDIVFTSKNGSIQTIPSLNKRLKSVTDPVIGLQYVWEYRSPSKSVPPHYQCKLCKVQRLQNEMAAHITGWKHCFRYLKQNHKDKVPHEEEAAAKDPAIRKAIKTTAAEVEKAEGRGQIKMVLREPFEVAAFQGMKSAQPNMSFTGTAGILGPPPRGLQQGGAFGGPFQDPMFRGDFSPRDGLMSDFPPGMRGGLSDNPMRRGQSDMGGFSSPGRYGNGMPGPDRRMMEPEGMQRFPDDGPMDMDPDGYGMGQRGEGMGRPFLNDMPMSSSDRMMGPGPKGLEGNSIPATLLKYLDTFRIENEDDAQIVLKVTQKLTDVLMEYRLRSISSPSMKSMTSSSLSSMNFSSSRLPHSSNDRFSSGISGPSRFYNN